MRARNIKHPAHYETLQGLKNSIKLAYGYLANGDKHGGTSKGMWQLNVKYTLIEKWGWSEKDALEYIYVMWDNKKNKYTATS